MFSYESLEVYKIAHEFHRKIYRFIANNEKMPLYVKNQFGRAAMSIVLNIAEGSAKFGDRDKRNFFIIARGSVFECSAIVRFLSDEQEMSHQVGKENLETLDSLSKMLFSMIKKLEK